MSSAAVRLKVINAHLSILSKNVDTALENLQQSDRVLLAVMLTRKLIIDAGQPEAAVQYDTLIRFLKGSMLEDDLKLVQDEEEDEDDVK